MQKGPFRWKAKFILTLKYICIGIFKEDIQIHAAHTFTRAHIIGIARNILGFVNLAKHILLKWIVWAIAKLGTNTDQMYRSSASMPHFRIICKWVASSNLTFYLVCTIDSMMEKAYTARDDTSLYIYFTGRIKMVWQNMQSDRCCFFVLREENACNLYK